MKKTKTNYLSPSVKVVDFVIERGFEASPYSIVQPETETDGMVEQMNYDEDNSLNWDWHMR